MCIAIVKPKGSEFPTMKQLENCFNANGHGAGFMYSDGENIILKKGFMTFKDFKKAYLEENISKDRLVFFHFRIATHGLRDGGNTHPFPVTEDTQILREKNLKFKGYGLIHNGVFDYQHYEFEKFGGSQYISDTMLFSIKLAEKLTYKYKTATTSELAIANYLKSKNKDLKDVIKRFVGYNKIAIMNEKEECFKFGSWIEDNGVFYSNDDYEGFDKYYNGGYNGLECCASCQEYVDEDKMIETIYGFVCPECIRVYEMVRCAGCGIYMLQEDAENTNLCDCCKKDFSIYACDKCKKTMKEDDGIYLTDKDEVVCGDCYSKISEQIISNKEN